jgi:hypothetical protein
MIEDNERVNGFVTYGHKMYSHHANDGQAFKRSTATSMAAAALTAEMLDVPTWRLSIEEAARRLGMKPDPKVPGGYFRVLSNGCIERLVPDGTPVTATPPAAPTFPPASVATTAERAPLPAPTTETTVEPTTETTVEPTTETTVEPTASWLPRVVQFLLELGVKVSEIMEALNMSDAPTVAKLYTELNKQFQEAYRQYKAIHPHLLAVCRGHAKLDAPSGDIFLTDFHRHSAYYTALKAQLPAAKEVYETFHNLNRWIIPVAEAVEIEAGRRA